MEDQDNEMDDEEHIASTVNLENQLKIPAEENKLEVVNNASTLASQETSTKNLVYITNIQKQ